MNPFPRSWVLVLSIAFPYGVSADSVFDALNLHVNAHSDGAVAFSFEQQVYRSDADLSDLPIGVFDSGIGGLTVLEALLTADAFDNKTLQPGPDGKPDFKDERFIYLGDQANMPYGNYPAVGKEDFLRELILKDAVFLLGNRYWLKAGAPEPARDKPPVKAIVIACNTATAFGLSEIRQAVETWGIPVIVVGVVEAGARGLLASKGEGAIGVMATVGTCASGVYPKTIQQTLGLAGRAPASISQFGSAALAGIIEGDPSFEAPLAVQIEADVRGLVTAHQQSGAKIPLSKIMLGCTHFPLVAAEIDAALTQLRTDPELEPWIAAEREFINPAEWTAKELFRELASARLRRKNPPSEKGGDQFYMSVPHASSESVQLTESGALEYDYKYGRTTGQFEIEDTVVVPMTRAMLPPASRRLVETKLSEVWRRLPH